jgi:hypothetical protein
MTLAIIIAAAVAVWLIGMAVWYYAFGSAIGRIIPTWEKHTTREGLYHTPKQEKDIRLLRAWSQWAPAWVVIVPLALVGLLGAGPVLGAIKAYKLTFANAETRARTIAQRKLKAEKEAARKKDEAAQKAEYDKIKAEEAEYARLRKNAA